MSKLSAVRPSFRTLLPTQELADAFADKTAAYEAARLVRDLRHAANLTQKELADRLAVSQARVSMIERGDGTDGPTFGLLKRIVLACGFAWNPRFMLESAAARIAPARSAVAAEPAATEAKTQTAAPPAYRSQSE